MAITSRGSRCRCSPRHRAAGGLGVHHDVHDLLGEAPEELMHIDGAVSNRGMENMSGVGSDKISAAVFVLAQNLLLW